MAPRSYSSSIRDAQVEQTRALLLEKARCLLVEGGIESLTLPKLAQAAGVSVPTVYRHFETPDDLFRALLEALRPELNLVYEHLRAVTPEQLPGLPLENYPRYESHAAVLRPLMDSREFNRVRVASMSERARHASERLKSHASKAWSESQLEELAGVIWVLSSPQVWRWLRDTWGMDNERAARAASWAIRSLLQALARGPEAQKPRAKTGKASAKKR